MRRPRKVYSSRIVHVPSTMEQTLATNIATVVFAVVSTVRAGTSATTNRLETDRDREVASGEKVGRITFSLEINPAASATGTVEYCVFKIQRSDVVPVIGTFPLPSSLECSTQGTQQICRLNMPGWIMKYGSFGVAGEQPRTRVVTVNPGKFKMGTVRDGDHLGIVIFNRTAASVIFSVQMRYSSWR